MADNKLNLPRITNAESTQRAFDSLKNHINNQETVLYRGKGDPNGELPAPLGSLYINENGGSNTSFYIKESEGSSSSGWTPACTVYSTTMPAGTIYAYGGTTVPTDFLLCDGSAVSRTTYAELFSAISTAWGVGDGSTTFNVPDLRGMFLRGEGTHGTQTMANGSAFDGGAVGDYVADKMQGHYHYQYVYDNTRAISAGASWNGDTTGGAKSTENTTTGVKSPKTDGTNGTPRTGTETKPVSYSIKYIILTKSTTLPVNVTTTSSGSTTYMVKCRSTDTTPDFMANKLKATAPIVKTILNSGANEVVDFSISDASTSAKGAVQLSSSYVGVLETVATTEKALSDGLGTKQNLNSNLTSVSGLTYASTSFVKMTGANTFTLDTNTYLTSLSGAVLTDQTTPQTVGTTSDRLAKLWATDIACTNAIAGSVTGNAGTVTNATFTTALTVNTGTVTLTGNVANTSVLTIGAGAVSVSGSNTGDQTSSDFDHDSLQNTHNLTTDIDHNSITNAHNLTTDIDHNSITNAHNLTTDIDHNSITNAHNLTTDIDHNSITNTHNLSTDIDHDGLTNTHNLTTDIDHNSIGGLNGGTAGEYYHLTSDEYDSATNVATTTATGLCPILSNNAGQFLDGTGNFSAPAGGGDVLAPATNTDNYVPQWNGNNSKTLKDGLAVGIADNNLLQVDDASVADNDYAKFTANGIEGVPYSTVLSDIGAEPTLPAGLIFAYAGSSIPTGWLDCNGAAVSRTTYADLFSAISTTWGAGDGSTTFNLPDLRSATLRGVGTPTLYTSNTVIALADTIDDKMQGHIHTTSESILAYSLGSGSPWASGTTYARRTATVTNPSSDGVNSTPRTGLETTGKARGVYHIIKY
jgi:microcystin-dependent protein